VGVVAAAMLLAACSPSATPAASQRPPGPSATTAHSTTASSPASPDGAVASASQVAARPAAGETTVACFPTRCGLHYAPSGESLFFGPVYAFTGHLADGSTIASFRVDNVVFSSDSMATEFGDSGLGLTDNQGNRTGQPGTHDDSGPTSDDLSKSNPACLSTSTPGYRFAYEVVPGYPVTLPKGVCLGFIGDSSPVVPTSLLWFDGYAIPLTPVGR
jgi:hypothetical protein